jgi:hypothetical protein
MEKFLTFQRNRRFITVFIKAFQRTPYIYLTTHPPIHPSIHPPTYLPMTLQPFVGPCALFQFPDLFTQSVGLLGREISPSQGRYLHAGHQKTQNRRTYTSMPQVGFEPSIPVFEQVKTVHAIDRPLLWSATKCIAYTNPILSYNTQNTF